ncbi:MAG: tetratricopeptide repeat protein [Halanaerobiales bacterium]|nr:tetratricopeptide repeat protein [Halanaerobiales bacterium]
MKKYNIVIGLLLIVFAISFSVGVEAQTEQMNLLSQSINNYHLNNYSKAQELINQINLDEITTSAKIDTLYYKSLIELALGNVSKGKEHLKQLNQMGYDYGLIHYELARIYMNIYNNFDSAYPQTALEEFEKANALGVNSAQFHRDYAMAYIGVNNQEAAVKQLEMAVSKDGSVPDYMNIANMYKEQNNYSKAEEYYRKLLDLDSQNTTAISELGDVLIEQEKYDQAIEILLKGVEITPDSVITNYNLGQAYYLNKEYDNAEKYLLKVVELKYNNYRALYYLGKTYEKKENFQNAKYYLNESTKFNPDYVPAYIALGTINLKEGNNYQAIANYSTAVEKNPEYADSHFHLALAYYQADMKEAAISELRKTLHLSDGHSSARQLLDRLQGE